MQTIQFNAEFILAMDAVKTGEKPFESIYQTRVYREMIAAEPNRQADIDYVCRGVIEAIPVLPPVLRAVFREDLVS